MCNDRLAEARKFRKQDSLAIISQQQTIAKFVARAKTDSIYKALAKENIGVQAKSLNDYAKENSRLKSQTKWLGGSALVALTAFLVKAFL